MTNAPSQRTAKRHPWPMTRQYSGLPAVFLDRDGVINEEVHYLNHPDQLVLIEGVGKAIARLNERGIPVIVFTNQSAIARGRLTEEGLAEIHTRLMALLASESACIDAIYYSPFHPDMSGPYGLETDCRKPGAGMLLAAEEDFSIKLKESVIVGDKISDLQAGKAVNARTIMVLTGHGADETEHLPDRIADYVVADLPAAVDVLSETGWIEEVSP